MADRGKRILSNVRKNEVASANIFRLLYKKVELTSSDAEYLYSIALSLINEFNKDNKRELLIEYAYYIIVKTALKTKTFNSLYDFSINYGFYPISQKLLDLELVEVSSINQIISSLSLDEFKDGSKVKTLEQSKVFESLLNDNALSLSFIAPTSYGKSEIIFEHLKREDGDKIGIVVPTKALIDQVSRDAKGVVFDRKIITHDQVFNISKDRRVLAVVTQERALRLLEDGLIFDVLYIDEAHEMIDFDFKNKQNNRSLLLARLISINRRMNSKTRIVYLSPVLKEGNSLRITGQENISEHKIRNDLKVLDVNFKNKNGTLYKYDRYLDEMVEISSNVGDFQYILENSRSKNLHFLYRPIYVETYSKRLFDILPDREPPLEILELMQELEALIHPKYKLVKYIRKGIIYLHAKMPANVKNYLMKFVRESEFITHFVANSVVLAGMNLPIENLFYISGTSNLRDINNLIGRVNRLNDIFKRENKDISKILIPLHFLEFEDFPQPHQGNLEKKVKSLRRDYDDDVRNPLLDSANISDNMQENATKIVKDEQSVITNYENPSFKEKLSLAGAQSILNYTDYGLLKLEKRISKFVVSAKTDIFEMIRELFFLDFDEGLDYAPEYNVKRLQRKETILYYRMFLDDLKNLKTRDRVNKVVRYWRKRAVYSDHQVYVGGSFGEIAFRSDDYPNSNRKVYVDIKDHFDDDEYLANLAIVKLQIDEEFLNYEISLLVTTLLKFNIISQDEFDEFFYGTILEGDLNVIKLGISRTLYRKLVDEGQIENIIYDEYGNAKSNEDFKRYIEMQTGIDRFELEQYFS